MTVLTSLSIGLVLFLIFLFLREKLAYIFTENNEVAQAVGDLSPLLAISILMNSIQPVLSGTSFPFCCQNVKLLSNLKSGSNSKTNNDSNRSSPRCVSLTGVALGAGWQSTVAYVNLSCYYLVGIPVGVVLGYVLNMQVEVSYFLIPLFLNSLNVLSFFHFY